MFERFGGFPLTHTVMQNSFFDRFVIVHLQHLRGSRRLSKGIYLYTDHTEDRKLGGPVLLAPQIPAVTQFSALAAEEAAEAADLGSQADGARHPTGTK